MVKFPRLFKRAILFRMNARRTLSKSICTEQDIQIEDLLGERHACGRMQNKIEETQEEYQFLNLIREQYEEFCKDHRGSGSLYVPIDWSRTLSKQKDPGNAGISRLGSPGRDRQTGNG
ncbi:MAG: hypothetical protein ACLTLQ_03450 [[Clostridium] scindens]